MSTPARTLASTPLYPAKQYCVERAHELAVNLNAQLQEHAVTAKKMPGHGQLGDWYREHITKAQHANVLTEEYVDVTLANFNGLRLADKISSIALTRTGLYTEPFHLPLISERSVATARSLQRHLGNIAIKINESMASEYPPVGYTPSFVTHEMDFGSTEDVYSKDSYGVLAGRIGTAILLLGDKRNGDLIFGRDLILLNDNNN